jgi:hypothetical protein
MSQVRIPLSDWTQPEERVAEVVVFDAEDCGGTERVTMAIYSGATTTHLRMTRAEVSRLIDALCMQLPTELEAA